MTTDRHQRDEDLDLLTARETARLLTVSQRTIDRWVAAGHLTPVVLPSGQRRFRASDVRALLDT